MPYDRGLIFCDADEQVVVALVVAAYHRGDRRHYTTDPADIRFHFFLEEGLPVHRIAVFDVCRFQDAISSYMPVAIYIDRTDLYFLRESEHRTEGKHH